MPLEGPEGGCPTPAPSNPGGVSAEKMAGHDITLLKPSAPPPLPLSFLHWAAEQTPQKVNASGDCLRKLIDATQTGAQPPCWELLEVCEGLLVHYLCACLLQCPR